MRWVRCACAAAACAAAVWLAGCGGGDGTTADVSGTVSYDGKPLEEGSISFTPADGKGVTGGGTVKDGKYTATKVPLGNTKVVITGVKVVDKKKAYDTPDSPMINVTKELLPPKYSDRDKTTLTFEVKPGKNEKNWELAK